MVYQKMRQLKFRIWDGNNKHFAYPDILELDRGLEYQQFTGLLDNQGKEIYEGDIIKGNYTEPFEVQWDAVGGLEDGSMDPEIWIVGFRFPADEELEAIGNIYEGLYK